MRQFVDPEEDRGEAKHWMPVSNIMTAAMLFLLVIITVGMIMYVNIDKDAKAAQNGQAVQGEQAMQGEQAAQSGQTAQGTQAAQNGQAVQGEQAAQSGQAAQGEQTVQGEQAAQAEKAATELKVREATLADRERTLAASETALKELAGVRTVIISELSEKLSAINLPIEINKDSGNIRFTEAVLFDVNKDSINAKGQQYLKTFVPSYLSILLSSKNEKYLDQIIIEGHADNGGTYKYNLDLSQKRADSVANFILAQNLVKLPNGVSADKYLTVCARSFNVPVLVNGAEDRSKSRRVEFVFRLKDDDMLKQMQDLYKGVQ